MEEAGKAGLVYRPGVAEQVKPNHEDILHDSLTGLFSALKTEPRQVPRIRDESSVFHASAWKRHTNPPLHEAAYWRTRSLDRPVTLDIFARERWNVTGLFLQAGVEYQFTAKGQWLDSSVPSGPGGTKDGDFHVAEVAHVAASALGKVESFFKRITDNPQADFWATRRVEDENWFALMGVIANGAVDDDPNHPFQNEVFRIGERRKYTPKGSGYLYCFANDAWHAYENNRGSVSLTVKRLSG
jgi:hypothetical protein